MDARWMLSISLRRASAHRVVRSRANASPAGALAHRGTEAQQRQTFGGARARDPRADGVDEMKLDQVARGGGRRRAACDGAAKLLQRGHHAASGDDQSTSLPCSWTATIADTMAWPRSSDRPTRKP